MPVSGKHLQALFSVSLLAILTLFIKCVDAENTYLQQHHAGHSDGYPQPGAVIAGRVISDNISPIQSNTTATEVNGIDISSLIDGLVYNWTQTDPQFNSSILAMSKLLTVAEDIKQALLSPVKARSTETLQQVPKSFKTENFHFPRQLTNSSKVGNSTLELAREIVRLAQNEANKRNVERLQNPRLNIYYTNDTSNAHATRKKRALEADLLPINSTVAAAAALVAEADAEAGKVVSAALNDTINEKRGLGKRAGSFWMETIEHTGQFPYGGVDNNGYKVFRNVKDYGAKGDGKTDDTAAINKAMADGNRCGPKCGSSSVKGAILYFPSGTYLISTPIESYYNTQMIGNVNDLPILLAAPSFVGLGVVSSDKYTGENGGADQWFINQSNFLRQIRNFKIDLTKANMVDIAGIHWQVAQATSLQNIYFYQSTAADKTHMGIFAENGSGGFMSDLTFIGGALGIRCGNQQFTTRKFTFTNVNTAIDMLWDWGWTWKSLDISGATYGIKVSGAYLGGSILVLDSKMTNVVTGIYVDTPKGVNSQQHFSINIDNLVISGVGTAVKDAVAGTTLAGGSTTIVSWTQGRVYDTKNPSGTYQTGGALSSTHPKTASLMGGPQGGYFERSKPQYSDLTTNDFLNAKVGAKGDGITDDTYALNLIIQIANILKRPLYMPAGSYIVTDTINFGVGTKILGECWSQIVGKGAKFSDVINPRVMVKVGEAGDSGVVEIQDLMFTQEGATSGIILMEWNIQDSTPGSAAMWDAHFRIGGAKGSGLQAADCPKLTGIVWNKCIAGTMLLHLTATSSAYLENVWAWVADHDLDSGQAQTQIDIYVARGILIESRKASWFYGTASEHCVLYQYQFFNARDIYLGMIQTESPYFLPSPQAPAPFLTTLGKFPSDPRFADCDASNKHCAAAWGVRIIGSTNIQIFGAGLYNWFQDYTQPCVDTQDCQQRVFEITGSSGVFIYNLYTIGTVEMLNTRGSSPILAKANTNQNSHPFTSIVNAWLLSSAAASSTDDINVDGWVDKAPCTAVYTTIDDIVTAKANIPSHCMDKYIAGAEKKILDVALTKYNERVNSGYDTKFQIYAKQIKLLVPLQLKAWISKAQASGFFSCTKTAYVSCCEDCQSAWECASGCDNSRPCTPGIRTTKVDCPTSIPNPTDQAFVDKIAYTCTDLAGFQKAILDEYGIDSSWVHFGDWTARYHGGCGGGNPNSAGCGALFNTVWTGFPLADAINVNDPKSLIESSYGKMQAFSADLGTQTFWSEWGVQDATIGDLVDAAAIPVLLTQSAVYYMGEVVEAADEISEQERKDMILNFIMGFLMLLPGVGAVAGSAGMLALRSIIRLLGNIGDAALAVYDIVDQPENAVSTIFLLLLGAGGRSSRSFTLSADKRRGMTEKELASVSSIRSDLDKITVCRTSCYK